MKNSRFCWQVFLLGFLLSPIERLFFKVKSMKKIKLTQGQVAIVDDIDYGRLSQYKWFAHKDLNSGNFYAVRWVKKNKMGDRSIISMARDILGLKKGDKRIVDHISHETLRNVRSNLRVCTHQENMCNMRNQKTRNGVKCTSPFKGVYWHIASSRWMAQIGYNGKKIYLGIFESEIQAARSYNTAASELFGRFAYLNNV